MAKSSPTVVSCSSDKDSSCQKKQQVDDCFTRVAINIINADNKANATCGDRGQALRSKLDSYAQNSKAMRRANASDAVYNVDTHGKLAPAPECLKLVSTNTDADLRVLESKLGLPAGKLSPSDFSNEINGYRAAVFYDQRDDVYLVSFRGTNKNNLVDWKNNINNQMPNSTAEDAPSYFAAKQLGALLAKSTPPVEYTGHSKGAGEVFEALSSAPSSLATVFNAAGPSPRIDAETQINIGTRTRNYQVGGEMLNLMQDEADPERAITNMKWLRDQLDDSFLGSNAMQITERDKATIEEKMELNKQIGFFADKEKKKIALNRLDQIDAEYSGERTEFIQKLDKLIEEKEKWLADRAAGKEVPPWKSPFSKSLGEKIVLGGSPTRQQADIWAASDHTMGTVKSELAKEIKKGKKSIEEDIRKLDPKFDDKVKKCGEGA